MAVSRIKLLADVDVAVHQLKAASQAIQEAMRQRLIDDDSMPQLCGKVLDKAVSELEKVDEDGNAFIVSVPIDSYLTEIWKSIGLSVFSWGCASDPVRS